MTDHEHEWIIRRNADGNIHIHCENVACWHDGEKHINSGFISITEAEAILNEHVALKRENEAGRLFGVWLQAIWEDEDFRKDGGGRTYAELLDYILACFPDALADTSESG